MTPAHRRHAYLLPWDMTTAGHKQANPLAVMAACRLYLEEAVATLGRYARGTAQQVWLRSPLYPGYYQKTFHYQTDGWFSSRWAACAAGLL